MKIYKFIMTKKLNDSSDSSEDQQIIQINKKIEKSNI